ncbi:glutaredoxin domain-containing protein [Arthrobacter sp. PsM3]|uniref:glutaredoxin domain-containing protein n=1 Tax=Arthrobacter sp. PsM3 TaxID=3030531 RepID=UPI00263A78EF|nr:glutaredoxin domain-containing protein [Arthrobacter sp. PsM3]MDN4644957.1 glutaredoxin domain-containing protein [Arthrobacter sp. PsM3]
MNHAQELQSREGVATVVYTKPNCVQCTQTFRMLDRDDVHYLKVDITEDPTARDFITRDVADGGLGYLQAPVVFVSAVEGDAHWSGFRPDLIEANITKRADAA